MKEILVIKLFSIGDVLMATPLVREIKRNISDSKITFLVGTYSQDVIRYNPYIDKIISVPDDYFVKKNIIQISNLILKHIRKKYDIIFLLHRATAFKFFSCFFHGKKICVDKVENNIPEYLKYLELLKLIGLNYSSDKVEIFLTKDEEEFSKKFLEGINTQDIIAISPGGGKNPKTFYPQKRWEREKYIELIKIIFEKTNASVVLLGDESEKEISQEITKISSSRIIDITGKTTLREAAGIIKNCKLFIGCDSGLTHIASAVDIPVIALFGPTDEKIWAPHGKKVTIVRKHLPCSPCYKNDGKFYNCKDNICMKLITPEDVWKNIENSKVI